MRLSPVTLCMTIYTEYIALFDFVHYLLETSCPSNNIGNDKAFLNPTSMVKL